MSDLSDQPRPLPTGIPPEGRSINDGGISPTFFNVAAAIIFGSYITTAIIVFWHLLRVAQ